jgi:hypothetical protein
MAKRPKRFFAGDEVSDSDSNSGMKEAYDKAQEERAKTPSADYGDYIPQSSSDTTKATARPTPKPAPKPAPETSSVRRVNREDVESSISKAAEPSSVRKLSREEGESIRKASAPAKSESTPVSAKKETYKDFSGNIQTKKSTTDRDAESAARREKVSETLKNVGSGIGSLFSKAVENYKSTVPRYNKEKKMAKGGTASSRADGIAQRGKTRGTMAAMCGGGMAKGKR